MTHTNEYPNMKTYKLMYYFGVWHTAIRYAAESDAEAIFDCDMDYYFPEQYSQPDLRGWRYGVALWQGNRMVKEYKPNNF